MPISLLSLVLLSALQVKPQAVPATGSQTATVTLPAPAMVRLSAQSGPGTACTIVDKVRGPLASAGQEGKSNCELDLLLDVGTYKLRLDSPKQGKGSVAIAARPFSEQNQKPVRLEKGRRVEQPLRSGEQASFWLSLSEREVPFLHLVGKNAGEVKLWRNGEWLEPVQLTHATFALGQSRAVHDWRLDELLEPGEYLVTAYGTSPLSGTAGEASDMLSVEYGFARLPPEGSVSFTLPPSGTLSYQTEKHSGSFAISLDATPTSPIELLAFDLLSPSHLGLKPVDGKPLPAEGGLAQRARVVIEAKWQIPQAAASASNDEVHVVTVRGAPGTRGFLEWVALPAAQSWLGGYYGTAQRDLLFEVPTAGDYLLGLQDLPVDTDGAPLGCQLERRPEKPKAQTKYKSNEVVTRDVLALPEGHRVERDFNYDGKGAIVWFEILHGERYRIQTLGDRKNRCEVWRLDARGELSRLTESKPDAKSCNEALQLLPGVYQLSLYDGLSGIEKLSIREDKPGQPKLLPHKAGCLMTAAGLTPGRYAIVATHGVEMGSRSLLMQPLPLSLDAPVHLTLDAERTFVVQAQKPGIARAAAGKSFQCAGRTVTGQCALNGSGVQLKNATSDVIAITLFHPSTPLTPPPLVAFDPKAKPLPRAGLDRPVYFDFERGQSHSLVFEVDKAGLYNVTTLGLLSTDCRLRTPVMPDVARDAGSGRGRNCLVSGYLRPGRYLLTATASGRSAGRGGLLMTRRSAREYMTVAGGGEAFFRVGAGELAQQRLEVKKDGEFSLSTTGQGVALQCRLDDSEGWPLVSVPTDCTQTRTFKSGSYLWTQFPLTVDSMRRTRLEKVKEPVVLAGNRMHPIELFTHYTARLDADGKDDFGFKLEGEASLQVVLTGGMQGRVYQLFPDKPPKAVEVIPPQQPPPGSESSETSASESSADSSTSTSEGSSSEGEGMARMLSGEGESEHRDGDGERREGSGDESSSSSEESSTRSRQESTPAGSALPEARPAPPPPAGVRITLPRGSYKLVAEHSRGDVGVEYQLHIGSEIMLPGMARELPVPVVVPVRMPRDGTLRLRTEGEADVRCRLFLGDRLIFEGADSGSDWNCAVAEPLSAGDYRLVIESRTQVVSNTRLSLSLANVEEAGQVQDGATIPLGSAVRLLPLPAASGDVVQELVLRGKSQFSCALEDGSGQVVHRKMRVTECALLIRPQGERMKVRVWNTDGTTQLTASFREKPVTPSERGAIPPTQASLLNIASAGRYTTGAGVFCLPGSARGLLLSCGPEASLPAGPMVFAGLGPKEQALSLKEELDEQTAKSEAAQHQPLSLGPRPWLQRLTARKRSVFLLSAEVQYGERIAPACGFDSGARELREHACFAASNVGEQAVAQASAPVAADSTASVETARRIVPFPEQSTALTLGRVRQNLAPAGSLFALPAKVRSRLELTLPGDAWAVLFDDGGRALELCAPGTKKAGGKDALSRCVMTGQGGQLLVVSSEPRADITTMLLDAAERSAILAGLYEVAPRVPGSLRLRAAPEATNRIASVDGDVRCTFLLSDGSRISGCTAAIPKGVALEIEIEHGATPLRAVLHAPGRERWARLGAIADPPQKATPLPVAVAVSVLENSGRFDRTLTIDKETVVQVVADAGVCALFRGTELVAVDGLASGCQFSRLLPAGTYRVVARPFAGQLVPGSLRWTAEPVITLGEGVAPEEWVAPNEVRVYRFSTASKGYVGLGMQASAESLVCAIYDSNHKPLGGGCQQYLRLEKGSYLLSVRLPPGPGVRPLRVKPVLLGLSGAETAVPAEYLKDLFRRIGVEQ